MWCFFQLLRCSHDDGLFEERTVESERFVFASFPTRIQSELFILKKNILQPSIFLNTY